MLVVSVARGVHDVVPLERQIPGAHPRAEEIPPVFRQPAQEVLVIEPRVLVELLEIPRIVR